MQPVYQIFPEKVRFNLVIDLVIYDEGGEVNDPDDLGGHTKFGITKARYPNEDIANLTIERAKYLYYRDFWKRFYCSRLYTGCDYFFFDMTVQHGKAVEILQRAVGAQEDNIIGPKTLAKCMEFEPEELLERMASQRAIYYLRVIGGRKANWLQKIIYPNAKFANGWANRMEKSLKRARHMVQTGAMPKESHQLIEAKTKTWIQKRTSRIIRTLIPPPKLAI